MKPDFPSIDKNYSNNGLAIKLGIVRLSGRLKVVGESNGQA